MQVNKVFVVLRETVIGHVFLGVFGTEDQAQKYADSVCKRYGLYPKHVIVEEREVITTSRVKAKLA